MSYGYIGDTSTSIKQQKKNAGVLSISDVLDLESQGFLGGSLELIEENVISSNVTSVDFNNIYGDKYNVHALEIRGLECDGGGSILVGVRFSTDGGSSYISSSDYQTAQETFASAGSSSLQQSNTNNQINLGYSNDTEQNNSIMYIYDANNSAKFTWLNHMSLKQGTDFSIGGGVYDTAATVNGIQVRGATFDTGVVRLYGVKTR